MQNELLYAEVEYMQKRVSEIYQRMPLPTVVLIFLTQQATHIFV